MLLQKSVTSPTLSSGAFTQEFGEFANIVNALVTINDLFTSAYAYACTWSASGNALTVTVKKQNLGSPGAWANPPDAALTGLIVTMLVDGE